MNSDSSDNAYSVIEKVNKQENSNCSTVNNSKDTHEDENTRISITEVEKEHCHLTKGNSIIDDVEMEQSLNTESPLLLEDTVSTINWLMRHDLLWREMLCAACGRRMNWNRCSRGSDGFNWKCQRKGCSKFKSSISIRMGSFMSKSNMSLQMWLKVMHMWSERVNCRNACSQLTVSRTTMISCFSFFRGVCESHFKSNPVVLGGPGTVLEIDQSCFTSKPKAKSERASYTPVWVFGIVDASSSPTIGFMEVVRAREPADLLPLIAMVARPGSIIPTKHWKEYRSQQGTDHSHVADIHSINFVDPQSINHVSTIQSYWAKHRSYIQSMHGCKHGSIQSYLQEYMWHERYSDKAFDTLCTHIAILYQSSHNHKDRKEESLAELGLESCSFSNYTEISTDHLEEESCDWLMHPTLMKEATAPSSNFPSPAIKIEDADSHLNNINTSMADVEMEQSLHVEEDCNLTKGNSTTDDVETEQSLNEDSTPEFHEEKLNSKCRKRALSSEEDTNVRMKDKWLHIEDKEDPFRHLEGAYTNINMEEERLPFKYEENPTAELILNLDDPLSTINWLKRRHLLKRGLTCPGCNINMIWMKCCKNTDGFTWRCQLKSCPKFKSRLSIRTGSHFSKSRIPLQKWVQAMHLWCARTPLAEAISRLDIPATKLTSCYSFFRNVCANHFLANPVQMGGAGVIVEMGDCFLSVKPKRQHERVLSSSVCVFALVNSATTPATGWVEMVRATDPATLLPLIEASVLPGTIIPSRFWREYRSIQGVDHTQPVDIHAVNFVDPNTIQQAAAIECYWADLKTYISSIRGCRQSTVGSYLREYMWRECHSGNAFEMLCHHIANQNNSPLKRDHREHCSVESRLGSCMPSKFSKTCSNQSTKDYKIGRHRQDEIVSSKLSKEKPTIKSDESVSSKLTMLPWLCEDTASIISWLQSRLLLKPEMKCIGCLKQMRWAKCKKTTDGFAWRCQTIGCPRYKNTFSIRTGSFFSKSHMSLQKWVRAMFMWTIRIGATTAGLLLDISVKTVMSFYSFFRDVCSLHFQSTPIRIGGPGVLLEIDAYCFSNVPKYHPSRSSKQPPIWVLGIVDTSTSPTIGYMEIVESRDPASFFPIIQSIVLPGSIIPSVYWKEYRDMQGIDSTEMANIHSLNFIDPESVDHVATIELYWEKHKSQIKTMHGCKVHLMKSYIQEFMWHERYCNDAFEHLCSHILHLYPE